MMSFKHMRAFGAIAVFAVVAAVFAVNARNELVRFDDLEYIAQNPHIKDGLTPRSVFWAMTTVGYAANWHPLTWISHAADVTLAKAMGLGYAEEPNPIGMWARVASPMACFIHIENVAWHASNAVLLYLVLLSLMDACSTGGRQRLSAVTLAVFCTLFWAVHPLRVEVVAWASERKELLGVFFALLSMLTYLAGDGSRPCTIFFSLLFFALSLLAKPVAVGFPLVLVAVEIFRGETRWRVLAERSSPYVLLAGCVCLLTLLAQRGAMSQGTAFPFKTRIGMILAAPAVYLRQTLWPSGLCADYAMLTKADWPWVVAGGVLHLTVGALVAFGVRAVKSGSRSCLIPLLVAWCYVCLLPMIGIVKVGYQPHSDRYTYWIGCGLSACLAIALFKAEPFWRSMADVFALIAVALLGILGGLSVAQSRIWRDNVSLMTDMVRKSRSPFMAQVLASEFVIRGQSGRAEEMLRELVAKNPCAYSYGALAWHMARRDENAEAESLADRALRQDPHCTFALGAMGLVAKNRREYAKAIGYLEESLKGNSDFELATALEECRGKIERDGQGRDEP